MFRKERQHFDEVAHMRTRQKVQKTNSSRI